MRDHAWLYQAKAHAAIKIRLVKPANDIASVFVRAQGYSTIHNPEVFFQGRLLLHSSCWARDLFSLDCVDHRTTNSIK